MSARAIRMADVNQFDLFRTDTRDICANRHGGNTESRRAFEKAEHGLVKNCFRVLEAIKAAGENGLTAKEYSAQSGKPLNAISGRFTDLKKDKIIIKTGERRDGSAVCVLRES